MEKPLFYPKMGGIGVTVRPVFRMDSRAACFLRSCSCFDSMASTAEVHRWGSKLTPHWYSTGFLPVVPFWSKLWGFQFFLLYNPWNITDNRGF